MLIHSDNETERGKYTHLTEWHDATTLQQYFYTVCQKTSIFLFFK